MKRIIRFLLRLLFGFQAFNEEVLRAPGPILLIPNHLSWIDWLFLGLCLDDDWKFVVSRNAAQATWLHRKIALNKRTFPVDMASSHGIKHMAEFLQKNGRMVLFAEGRISRTGRLMKLFEGTGFLLHRTGAKVITAYLRGAHRLPLSPNRDLKRLFPRVTLHFSKLLSPPAMGKGKASEARDRLTDWLRDQIIEHQFQVEMTMGPRSILDAIVRAARRAPAKVAVEDVTAQKLSYRRLLVGAKLLGEQLSRFLVPGVARVGVLLPNANVTPVTMLALWSVGKVPAVLNYSTGAATMLTCARLAGLRQVITSRLFLERAKLEYEPLLQAGLEFIYVEDLRNGIGGFAKFRAMLLSLFRVPHPRGRANRPGEPHDQEAAVVLFTSGSEGTPKAVELSHRNVLANLHQVLVISDIQDWDRMFNALPLFHSFGLAIGTLLPLMRGIYVYLYVSPLHYRVVPNMIYITDCTIVLATNTFLHGYARAAHPMDFRTVRYLFAGAEKVQESTINTYTRQFGVRILEGYGATECSPVISVNVPNALKFGTAGRLMPGMEYRLEPVEGVAEGGRLFVRGPNIMMGYVNAEPNAKFQNLDGWYDTGDIAKVDEQRFVTLLGRAKRFAKVSGEMISLMAVEDALSAAFPQFGQRFQIAVVTRPDEEKGEALIAVTNEPKLHAEDLRQALRERGFPNLAVPRELRVLNELPALATGKINHRELEKMLHTGSAGILPAAQAPQPQITAA
jgi:acyl-[acyl-carrier-protein]-phospholipid O-acyltransferase/long-chain-fatty-acid--[acyl-carrier-protein] ligase